MRIYRKRSKKGSRYHSFVQLQVSEEERQFLSSSGLMNIKIHMHGGSLAGSRLTPLTALQVFQTYVNRIRNRWNLALTRTTGWVLIDTVILYVKMIGEIIRLLLRFFFGTRKKVTHLVRGIAFSSTKVEDVKDTETFIFTSIAAVHHAIEFARNADREDYFEGDSYKREVEGLTFSGVLASAGVTAASLSDLSALRAEAEAAEEALNDELELADADADFGDAGVELPEIPT